MTSAYTMELRVLLCPSCGAPTDALLAGGVCICKFCNAQSHLAPRATLPAFAPPPRPRLSEPERYEKLRAQEGQPLNPPARIAPMFARGARIGPVNRQDAMAAWQSARKRTASQGADAYTAAAELIYLTLLLGNEYVERKDWRGHRAMLESAFEAFFLPHHRSAIAADLVSGACRQNDLVGAATWLALCDPFSEDLHADSNYRFARAHVARLRHDWNDVLAVLGSRTGEVPVHEAMNSTVTVSRAHALENLGAIDAAARELDDHMGGGPDLRRRVALITSIHSLCPRSFPQAHASVRKRASYVAEIATGGRAHVGFGALFGGGGRSPDAAARAETARRLAIEGRDASGTVFSVADTGIELDELKLWRLHVRVEIAGFPQFESAVELRMSSSKAASFAGKVIFLLADPRDIRIIASEATAGPVDDE